MKNFSKITAFLFAVFFCGTSAFAQAPASHIFGVTSATEISAEQGQKVMTCTPAQIINRTFDGSCNNLNQTNLGAAGTALVRKAPADYADGDCSLVDRGNPREISNIVFSQIASRPDFRTLSSYSYTWLQFIDHDITLSPTGTDVANIPIPLGDPIFDPNGTGTQEIPFHRSASSGTPCVQTNAITHWLDGSMIYGSDVNRANWLRTFSNGKLKTSPSVHGDLLPCNTVDGNCNSAIDPNAPAMAGDTDEASSAALKVFVAGDERANEQPSLTAMHTLFVREHNRLCDQLIASGLTNDESIYQRARKIVSAEIQAITYNEMLFCIGIFLGPYSGYDENADPSIMNEFATAAYRLGHTMVPSSIPLRDELCREVTVDIDCNAAGLAGPCPATYEGEIALRDGFFNPSIIAASGIEPILVGLSSQNQEAVDRFVIDDLRNFLFGAPGQGGLDLVSLNIQRARDHGVPDYNTVRQNFNLAPVRDFAEISSDPATAAALSAAYGGNIDEIDAWVGMLAEDQIARSSLGETLHAILKEQFENLRDADRFWYQIDPSFTEGDRIQLANTKMDDLVRRNSTAKNLDNLVFTTTCPEGYCIPDYSAIERHCYTYISNVSIEDIAHPTTATTSAGAGYNDHTDISTKLMAGLSYTLSVDLASCKTGSTDTRFNVWIDWNGDGVFNEEEEHITDQQRWYDASLNLLVPITVPEDARPGPIRLRIRADFHATTYYEACTPYTNQYNGGPYANVGGETEDYTLVVCNDYCVPDYTDSNCNGYISGVELKEIANIPTNESAYAASYQIFDFPRAFLTQGSTYTVTVNLATCVKESILGAGVDLDLGLWIDWNSNGVFDAGESIYDSNDNDLGYEWVAYGEPNEVAITFTVPSDAAEGLTKLRVRAVNSPATDLVDPCDEYLWGETEDYCIIIMPSVCEPTYTTPSCDGYIHGLSLGDYTNFPTDESLGSGGYSSYLDTCVNLQAGETHRLKAYLFTCASGGIDLDLGVWIDFNQNGIFDLGESIYDSNEIQILGYEWLDEEVLYEVLVDFAVPAGTPLGKTRLRLRTNTLGEDTSIDPCLEYTSGETEDYYVNITGCETRIANIQGDSIVLEGSTVTYTVAETDATAVYNWSVPQDAAITTGQGSNTISISWGMTGGQVVVTKTTESCGTASTAFEVSIESITTPCMNTPTVCGVNGATIEVPVTVANFNEVNGFQFSTKWDPSVARFLALEDFALTGTPIVNPDNTVGYFSIVWSDIFKPSTLADGAVLFTLHFEVVGDPGDRTGMTLSNDPSPEFTMGLPPTTSPDVCVNFGAICVDDNLRLSGAVCTPIGGQIGTPASTDVMVYDLDDGSETAIVPNPINYRIDNLADGADYMLSPFTSEITSNCTVTDIVYTQYMIVNLLPFTSPYQFIAADVDGNGGVSVTDIVYMQYLITGLLPSFPNGTYTYVCTDNPPTLAAPFDFRRSYMLDDLETSHFGLDYIGVELGDVNGAAGVSPPTLRTQAVSFDIPKEAAAPNTTVQIPVKVNNFTNVTGFQYSIEWDEEILEYVGVRSLSGVQMETSNFNLTALEDGKLGVVWHDPSLAGMSLESDATLFEMEFNVIGKANEYSSISINSSLIPTEIINANLAHLPLNTEAGEVAVETLTTSETPVLGGSLLVVPNPLVDRATIQFERQEAGDVKLEIFNSLGQSVWSFEGHMAKGLQEVALDATRLSNGIYFLQLKGKNDTDQIEIVIFN